MKPVIDQIFPIEQYQQAFDRLEKAEQLAKLVFTLANIESLQRF